MSRKLVQAATSFVGLCLMGAAVWMALDAPEWGMWRAVVVLTLLALGALMCFDRVVGRALDTAAPYLPWLDDPEEDCDG